ncbi:membrane protein [Staphylococcus microti]|uniref:Membrane protein n=1 Tax=Staphylococcus microti TaxID=569857 RepID=A0A0D6XMW3_9STAP|nr:membrane protein [Staphylococcus microti]KIX89845.1 membrane protein [Staphylococcus microti]PNZ80031.1 hypothetical protein CD132_08570 [Staphylococcus microti]SUM58082.1 membrane protein [Staphylococcus microti]
MKWISRQLLAILFTTAGYLHFKRERNFRNIVPHYLPFKREIVWLTGVMELIFGIGLALKKPGYWFKHAIIAFLWAVFPANIYMARHQLPLGDKELSKKALYGRLPLQFVLMAWVRKL